MATPPPAPTKQRTRDHILADLSVNHVERFILESGHIVNRNVTDYGYDLHMVTFDSGGFIEPGAINLQLKATERLTPSGSEYVFDLDVRDYNLWVQELLPVVFILYEASRRRAYWVHIQNYFGLQSARHPRKGAKSVRIKIQARQRVTKRGVELIRQCKPSLTI
jgi:hypothetical protein